MKSNFSLFLEGVTTRARSAELFHYTIWRLLILTLGLTLQAIANQNPFDAESPAEVIRDRCQASLISSINLDSGGRECGRKSPSAVEGEAFRIVIDAGHGGKDRGAEGFFGISEKYLSVELARFLRKEVEDKAKTLEIPVKIKMTREEDAFLSLHERVELANEWPADLFVCLHANWSSMARTKSSLMTR